MQLLFKPDEWHTCSGNDWKACNNGINCYAYVLNQPEYHWAVPGHGFAIAKTQNFYDSFSSLFKGVSRDEFRKRLITGAAGDGLIPVDKPTNRSGHYAVVLFFPDKKTDYLDFHWYRRDDDGTWSHKDGWHSPSNKDSHGETIKDPRKLKNTDYPVFGGFFLVPRNGIQLKQSFPLLLAKP